MTRDPAAYSAAARQRWASRDASATIGGRVRAQRESLWLTQAELARRLGVMPARVSAIERSARLRTDTVSKIAAALGCDLSALLS